MIQDLPLRLVICNYLRIEHFSEKKKIFFNGRFRFCFKGRARAASNHVTKILRQDLTSAACRTVLLEVHLMHFQHSKFSLRIQYKLFLELLISVYVLEYIFCLAAAITVMFPAELADRARFSFHITNLPETSKCLNQMTNI